MQPPAFAVIVVVVAVGAACTRNTPAPDCIEHLVAPNYPPIAASARLAVDGVHVEASIDKGQVQSLRVTFPPEAKRYEAFFRSEVETALRRSRFKVTCGTTTVAIVVDFVLADYSDPDPPSTQRIAFRPPNRVVVSMTGRVIDSALLHDLTIATRNVAHVGKTGARVVDPFDAR